MQKESPSRPQEVAFDLSDKENVGTEEAHRKHMDLCSFPPFGNYKISKLLLFILYTNGCKCNVLKKDNVAFVIMVEYVQARHSCYAPDKGQEYWSIFY